MPGNNPRRLIEKKRRNSKDKCLLSFVPIFLLIEISLLLLVGWFTLSSGISEKAIKQYFLPRDFTGQVCNEGGSGRSGFVSWPLFRNSFRKLQFKKSFYLPRCVGTCSETEENSPNLKGYRSFTFYEWCLPLASEIGSENGIRGRFLSEILLLLNRIDLKLVLIALLCSIVPGMIFVLSFTILSISAPNVSAWTCILSLYIATNALGFFLIKTNLLNLGSNYYSGKMSYAFGALIILSSSFYLFLVSKIHRIMPFASRLRKVAFLKLLKSPSTSIIFLLFVFLKVLLIAFYLFVFCLLVNTKFSNVTITPNLDGLVSLNMKGYGYIDIIAIIVHFIVVFVSYEALGHLESIVLSQYFSFLSVYKSEISRHQLLQKSFRNTFLSLGSIYLYIIIDIFLSPISFITNIYGMVFDSRRREIGLRFADSMFNKFAKFTNNMDCFNVKTSRLPLLLSVWHGKSLEREMKTAWYLFSPRKKLFYSFFIIQKSISVFIKVLFPLLSTLIFYLVDYFFNTKLCPLGVYLLVWLISFRFVGFLENVFTQSSCSLLIAVFCDKYLYKRDFIFRSVFDGLNLEMIED